MKPVTDGSLEKLLAQVRACEIFTYLPLGPRPTVWAQASARILIIGEASPDPVLSNALQSLGLGHFVGQKIPGISDNILMNFLQIGPHIQYVLLFDF